MSTIDTQNGTYHISIYVDGVWAGGGVLDRGTIIDCSAQFCDDPDDNDRVYDLIEDAIEDGKYHLTVTIDGEKKRIDWIIAPLED